MDTLRKGVVVMLFVGLTVVFLYFTKDLLMPLALAGLIAMLFRSLSNKLEKRGVKRWLSALISVVIFLASVAVVIGLLSWQLMDWLENMTEMQQRVKEQISSLRDWVQEAAGIDKEEQEKMVEDQVESAAAGSQGQTGGLAGFAMGTVGIMVDTVLVIVYTFLLLLYRTKIKEFILRVTSTEYRSNAKVILEDASLVAQQYLVGLASMIGVLWVMYGIGFSVVGVEGALFFAVLCGVLEIVPFVGNMVGTALTLLAVVVQGGGSTMILGVLGVYVVVQGVQTYVLEPLIVGRQVNINPLFTIVALVAGELIWGISGMILAIPMLGILKIICDHIPPLQPYGELIGSEKKKKNSKKKQ